ncbi:hypothetical protein FQR65_LT19108 [Abscondita terminalis]|nr:hypothetical protein FQR65_LT19108 [Abscondita terminalis]
MLIIENILNITKLTKNSEHRLCTLDKDGNLAAGPQPEVRVPNADKNIGISGTGWGEFIYVPQAARTVAANNEYQNNRC